VDLLEEIELEYNDLIQKEKRKREKTVLSNDDYTFTLQDMFINNQFKQQAQFQNIINSIPKIFEDKIFLFKTITLIPSTYTKENDTYEEFKKILIAQKEIFNAYNRKFRLIKDKRYLYIYELTEKRNFHLHQGSFFNSIEDIKEYIKKTFISKKKNPLIGRLELKFKEELKDEILDLFNHFKIKGYGTLTIDSFEDRKENETIYFIKESWVSKGNYIKIAFIEDFQKDDTSIQKYLFKYILKNKNKEGNEFVDSLETKVCKVIGVKQYMFSNKFYHKNFKNETILRLNDKLYSKLENKEEKDICIYHTIEFLKSGVIYEEDNIFYYEDEEILNLNNKYEKNEYNSKLESLYYKYLFSYYLPTKYELYYMYALYIFDIYNHDKNEIYKIYEVDTVKELSDYFILLEEIYKEERENERLTQNENYLEQIEVLHYQKNQIEDNILLTQDDLKTLALIDSKLSNYLHQPIKF
jgi:hypothetical protein